MMFALHVEDASCYGGSKYLFSKFHTRSIINDKCYMVFWCWLIQTVQNFILLSSKPIPEKLLTTEATVSL